jgi:hypothetical protein
MKILDTWFFIARCMRCILNGFEWVLTHSHLGLLLRIGHGETNPEIRGLAKLGSDAENDGNCVWKLCFIGYPQLLESAHSRKNGQKVPFQGILHCPFMPIRSHTHTIPHLGSHSSNLGSELWWVLDARPSLRLWNCSSLVGGTALGW